MQEVCDDNVVIIIDSGIDKKVFNKDIVGGVNIGIAENRMIIFSEDYSDVSGHGTACAHIIKREFNEAKFYVIKILNAESLCYIEQLIVALDHCLSLHYKIINVSLAVNMDKAPKDLEKICQRLKSKGKIVIASVANRKIYSCPAVYPSVIGVRGLVLNSSSIWFNQKYSVQCIADRTPKFTGRDMDAYFLFGGNSMACAYITGRVLHELSYFNVKASWLNVVETLKQCATNHIWEAEVETSITHISKIDYSSIESDAEKKIKQSIYSITGVKEVLDLAANEEIMDRLNLNASVIKKLVERLELDFSIQISDNKITFEAFRSVLSLRKLIGDKV